MSINGGCSSSDHMGRTQIHVGQQMPRRWWFCCTAVRHCLLKRALWPQQRSWTRGIVVGRYNGRAQLGGWISPPILKINIINISNPSSILQGAGGLMCFFVLCSMPLWRIYINIYLYHLSEDSSFFYSERVKIYYCKKIIFWVVLLVCLSIFFIYWLSSGIEE